MRFSKSMLPWCAASLGLVALACGDDGPLEPLDPDRPTPAAIASVSGDDQQGKAGEKLGEPFVVRVTDAQGDGVAGLQVTWRVASGAGDFGRPGNRQSTALGSTNPDGIAREFFRPTALGASTVTAEVAGLQGSPVTFTADATSVVIRFSPLFDCTGENDPVWFVGPDDSNDPVTVPVGTTVEWVEMDWSGCGVRIVSTSAPAGGEPFDSGILNPGERFQFVPGMAGTWEYSDKVSGGTGTLTAR